MYKRQVLIKENNAITSRLLTLDRDLLMIPSVAIHMNREVNDKASYNKQVDMLPLLGSAAEEGVLKKLIAAELQVAEEQILGSDLFLCICLLYTSPATDSGLSIHVEQIMPP